MTIHYRFIPGILLFLCLYTVSSYSSETKNITHKKNCPAKGICLQVLGSGGPEVEDKRASSAYLIWLDGKPRLLIDAGGGSALRFGQSDAFMSELYAVAFSHFHIDHSSDFPALIKSSYFGKQRPDLPVFGPQGNTLLPSTTQFISRLFNVNNGVWPYMSDFLATDENNDHYHLLPQNVSENHLRVREIFNTQEIKLSTISVHHGPLPALAWRVDIDTHSIVFSGDMNNDYHSLVKLAKNADILVAHNAIAEGTTGVARNLHMPPSEIGKIAQSANIKTLVLSHLMLRTLDKKSQTLQVIGNYYKGKTLFANDLDTFVIH